MSVLAGAENRNVKWLGRGIKQQQRRFPGSSKDMGLLSKVSPMGGIMEVWWPWVLGFELGFDQDLLQTRSFLCRIHSACLQNQSESCLHLCPAGGKCWSTSPTLPQCYCCSSPDGTSTSSNLPSKDRYPQGSCRICLIFAFSKEAVRRKFYPQSSHQNSGPVP